MTAKLDDAASVSNRFGKIRDFWISVHESVVRLLMWVVFVGFFGSIPLLASFVHGSLRGHPPTLEELVGQGELLLICCAVCADAMGRILYGVRKRNQGLDFMRYFFIVSSLIVIVFCTILFVDLRYAVHGELSVGTLVTWSKWMAALTFWIGVWTTLFASD